MIFECLSRIPSIDLFFPPPSVIAPHGIIFTSIQKVESQGIVWKKSDALVLPASVPVVPKRVPQGGVDPGDSLPTHTDPLHPPVQSILERSLRNDSSTILPTGHTGVVVSHEPPRREEIVVFVLVLLDQLEVLLAHPMGVTHGIGGRGFAIVPRVGKSGGMSLFVRKSESHFPDWFDVQPYLRS
jgi:hypothetical protein